MSTQASHGDASHGLPLYITGPGETDILFVFVVVLVLVILLIAGNFYFKIHALPEHMAHGRRSTQFQLVGILALLALFTHQNLYWVAALVLAAVRLPDYLTPLESIAESQRQQRPEGPVSRQVEPPAAEPVEPASPSPESAPAPATSPERTG